MGYKLPKKETIITLRENGETYQNIADKYGVSRQAVWATINTVRKSGKNLLPPLFILAKWRETYSPQEVFRLCQSYDPTQPNKPLTPELESGAVIESNEADK